MSNNQTALLGVQTPEIVLCCLNRSVAALPLSRQFLARLFSQRWIWLVVDERNMAIDASQYHIWTFSGIMPFPFR